MKINDLKNGMILKLRDNTYKMVIKNKNEFGWAGIDDIEWCNDYINYADNLTYNNHCEYDIMQIYEPHSIYSYCKLFDYLINNKTIDMEDMSNFYAKIYDRKEENNYFLQTLKRKNIELDEFLDLFNKWNSFTTEEKINMNKEN